MRCPLRAGRRIAAGAGQAGDQHRAFDADVSGAVRDGKIANELCICIGAVFADIGALRARVQKRTSAAGERHAAQHVQTAIAKRCFELRSMSIDAVPASCLVRLRKTRLAINFQPQAFLA